MEWDPTEVLDITNKQYYSKELKQGFPMLFPLQHCSGYCEHQFEISKHIPTCDYIKRLLATTRPLVGIQMLETPMTGQILPNGHSVCYKYPPELKPIAKRPHGILLWTQNELWVPHDH